MLLLVETMPPEETDVEISLMVALVHLKL